MARPNDLLTHQLGVGLDYLAFHSLCFGNLIGGHFFGEGVSFFTTFFISIGRSNIEPHMGSDVVLKDAVGVVLQNTKVVLTLGKALLSGFRKPLYRLLIILKHNAPRLG